ncbi:hypothetical protein E3N88_38461 [Mikania micrantha]|uniref:Uncharacterized protein n=1 Tax=Mikania micrantha TaxID=192012 RepID=A0A5N6LU31_9ASTR|nr:hypothetical protein E3N88_38461 [Mikania micrantha]
MDEDSQNENQIEVGLSPDLANDDRITKNYIAEEMKIDKMPAQPSIGDKCHVFHNGNATSYNGPNTVYYSDKCKANKEVDKCCLEYVLPIISLDGQQ